MQLSIVCREPHAEPRIRIVSTLEVMPATLRPVWERLCQWNPTLTPDAIQEFYRNDRTYYTVDDVGLMWHTAAQGDEVEAHFVFWDKRLRGRELLVRKMAQLAMERTGTHKAFAFVPRIRSMILKFLFRCGFTMEFERQGLCKVYLLRD